MHAPAAVNPEMWNYGALMTTEGLIALATLTAMEIVLGIDNIVFIAIVTGKVPEAQRAKVRNLGLILALVLRVGLLFAITWVMTLTTPLFTVLERGISGQSLILLIGGLFLIGKATYEIHHRMEGDAEGHGQTGPDATIGAAAAGGTGAVMAGTKAAAVSVPFIIGQIIMLDLVFSLDSVITAVGMAKQIPIMIIAVMIAVGVMITFAGRISRFVERHPTVKMLALAFLVLIGVMLVAEGVGEHIEKGYIYFAMAFSLGVEMLNIRAGAKKRKKAAAAAAHG